MLSKSNNIMTPKMESWIERIEEDLIAGKNVIGPFASNSEMDKFLLLASGKSSKKQSRRRN